MSSTQRPKGLYSLPVDKPIDKNVSFDNTASEEHEVEKKEFLTIGALAKLANVTVRTLRYYEEMDLIGPVKRSSGKYRLYSKHSLKRIDAIQALQSLNFSLEDIVAILGAYSKSLSYTREEQMMHTRESLIQQKALIDQKIVQLNYMSQEIESRLGLLDTICSPCTTHKPHESCAQTCHYLEVHL